MRKGNAVNGVSADLFQPLTVNHTFSNRLAPGACGRSAVGLVMSDATSASQKACTPNLRLPGVRGPLCA